MSCWLSSLCHFLLDISSDQFKNEVPLCHDTGNTDKKVSKKQVQQNKHHTLWKRADRNEEKWSGSVGKGSSSGPRETGAISGLSEQGQKDGGTETQEQVK